MSKSARQSSKSSPAPATQADTESAREMMQAVLSKPRKAAKNPASESNRINGVVIGTLSGSGENGQPLVDYPGMPSDKPITAISTENLSEQQAGHEVALGFVNGNPSLPIILGLIQKTGDQDQVATDAVTGEQAVNVKLDGERLTLSADKEIVLQCGKSSITLTRAGKVIIKGAYLSNHSTGVNRIKGGSVQIN